MIIPDYCVTDVLSGRDMRLAPTLAGIRVRELLRFTDDCANFIKLFPLQDQLIATLFHEQQLNPMLKAYKESNNLILLKRENLCMNGSASCPAELAIQHT